jgi:signal transduction histidine kinase/ActR/RegA family two-component response regulator
MDVSDAEILELFEEQAALPGGLMIKATPGMPFAVAYCNPTAAHLLGLPRIHLEDEPLEWASLPQGLAAYLVEAFQAFQRDPNTVLPVLEIQDPVKAAFSVKMSHHCQPVGGVEHHSFYFTFNDVTAWLSLQEEVMNARRLESIGALASGVAHDFNNILMVIRGHADFIAAVAPQDDTIGYSIDQIRRACHSGAGLTQSLLGFARKQSLIMQPMNLGVLVAEVADLCRRTYGARYHIVMDPVLEGGVEVLKKDKRLMIHGCSAALGHCLLNVLNNARDSMPEGGPIEVRHRIEGRTILLAISDRGVGIESRDLRQIFEPFFTTKQKGAGTGLGLSLALSIMKQHAGEIRIDSEKGAGTTVTFAWPCLAEEKTPGEQADGAAERPPPPAAAHMPQRAFLIDDDDMVRSAVAQLLKLQNVETDRFSNAEDALKRMEAGDLPTLVFVDYTMPGMDGITCMREMIKMLRAYSTPPYMKLVLISGHPPSYFHEFLKEFDGSPIYLLQKPFSAEDVNRILRLPSKKVLRRTTSRLDITPEMIRKPQDRE